MKLSKSPFWVDCPPIEKVLLQIITKNTKKKKNSWTYPTNSTYVKESNARFYFMWTKAFVKKQPNHNWKYKPMLPMMEVSLQPS